MPEYGICLLGVKQYRQVSWDTVLDRTAVLCAVPDNTSWYLVVPRGIALYCAVLRSTALYCAVLEKKKREGEAT